MTFSYLPEPVSPEGGAERHPVAVPPVDLVDITLA